MLTISFSPWNVVGQICFVDRTLNSVILFEARLEYWLGSSLPSGSVDAGKLKRRQEAIIEEKLGKGDSFDLTCLYRYPSWGDRSTLHLTMQTEPEEGLRANTDWDSETCKIHACCKTFDDKDCALAQSIVSSCNTVLICLTLLSWPHLPIVLITHQNESFQEKHQIGVGNAWICKMLWVGAFFFPCWMHEKGKWFYELTHFSCGIRMKKTSFELRFDVNWPSYLVPVYSNITQFSPSSQVICAFIIPWWLCPPHLHNCILHWSFCLRELLFYLHLLFGFGFGLGLVWF